MLLDRLEQSAPMGLEYRTVGNWVGQVVTLLFVWHPLCRIAYPSPPELGDRHKPSHTVCAACIKSVGHVIG
ncbi:MAG: hypothetical protein ACK4LB_00410 [Spirosomataceae bacterium]